MSEVILTKQWYKELEDKLNLLKTVKRQEISQIIAEARAQGDLSENAEYDAAKDEQARIEGEIVEIEAKLRNAKIIEKSGDDSTISLGSEVKILNLKNNKEMVYRIVGTTESDPFNNKISNESPVGKALLGKRLGDVVDVVHPNGTIQFKIGSASKSILDWMRSFLANEYGICNKGLSYQKLDSGKDFWNLLYYGENVRKLYQLLYKNPESLKMDRKYNKFTKLYEEKYPRDHIPN